MVLALLFLACNGNDKDTPTDTGTVPTSLVVEDVFVQAIIDPIDIVWVLDPNWAQGFESLESARQSGYETLLVADSDWKMGFTSSDVQNPTSRGVIRGAHRTVFPPEDTWFLPQGGERSRPLDAMASVFQDRLETNADFLREDAHLHFIVLTDTRDRSDIGVDELLDVFAPIVGDYTLSIGVSALVSGSESVQDYWRQATAALGGRTYVAGSWDRGIVEMYRSALNIRSEFALSETPISPPREVVVTFRERSTVYALSDGFDYLGSRNVIRFVGEPPQPGSTIRVEYETSLESVADAGVGGTGAQ